jgi:Lanthionine-containing peptide SapB precursor RamS
MAILDLQAMDTDRGGHGGGGGGGSHLSVALCDSVASVTLCL